MKKNTPIKITIVEHINDNNEWVWYDIYKNSACAPEQAVKDYLEDMGLNLEQEIKTDKDGMVYATEDDVRAYNYTI